jgi:hypothetical protein
MSELFPKPYVPPKVFVSYSHDSDEHIDWVRRLAERLCANGVDTILDQWDTSPGDDVTWFMERGLADSDRVLIICTKEYLNKANNLKGGVGYERMIITAEVARNLETKKFIPIVRSKQKEVLPGFIGNRIYVDFGTATDINDIPFELLLRSLHGAPKYRKPPLGQNPYLKGENVSDNIEGVKKIPPNSNTAARVKGPIQLREPKRSTEISSKRFHSLRPSVSEAELPIWKFGTRWDVLREYGFAPSSNVPVPAPDREKAYSQVSRSLDPISTLMPSTLLVVSIALLSLQRNAEEGLSFWAALFGTPEGISIVCYLASLISFFWYGAQYYRLIWNDYFALSEEDRNDASFFIGYAFLVAVISIVGMFVNPLIWPAYIILIFLPLGLKIMRTARLFRSAADAYLKQVRVSDDVDEFVSHGGADYSPLWVRQIIAARALIASSAINFFFWGIMVLGLSSIVVFTFAFYFLKELTYLRQGVIGSREIVSVLLAATVVTFYAIKIGGGIQQIKQQVEIGEWSGFSLFRVPWSSKRSPD